MLYGLLPAWLACLRSFSLLALLYLRELLGLFGLLCFGWFAKIAPGSQSSLRSHEPCLICLICEDYASITCLRSSLRSLRPWLVCLICLICLVCLICEDYARLTCSRSSLRSLRPCLVCLICIDCALLARWRNSLRSHVAIRANLQK